MKVLNEFLRLFSPSAGKVNVAGKYVAMPVHRGVETNRRRASAAARLYVAGSTGLKRFHLVPEEELSERKEKVLQYDFAAIG